MPGDNFTIEDLLAAVEKLHRKKDTFYIDPDLGDEILVMDGDARRVWLSEANLERFKEAWERARVEGCTAIFLDLPPFESHFRVIEESRRFHGFQVYEDPEVDPGVVVIRHPRTGENRSLVIRPMPDIFESLRKDELPWNAPDPPPLSYYYGPIRRP